MEPAFELALGLALLGERNQNMPNTLKGWSGLLVQVAQQQILVRRDDLKEIISVNGATRVIDQRTWLVGVLGYEGAIVPLIEYRCLLNKDAPSLGLQDRQALIIPCRFGNIALLVDKVKGSRDYWSDDAKLSGYSCDPNNLFVISFQHEGQLIKVLDHEKLAAKMGVRQAVMNAAL